jgi:endonuclease III
MRQGSFDFGERPVLREVRERLLAAFGPQRDDERFDPVSQLIYGILASKTKDEVSMTAFLRLQARCATWDVLLHTPPKAIERIIWTVNHADRKAEELPLALRKIRARNGALDLEFLADWDVEGALQWLDGLPGVGPKIAATVLNFSHLRKRVLVVDTHVLRVGERLGLLCTGADYQEGYDGYARLLPEDWDGDVLYELHWLIKRLGQQLCRPSLPACGTCPLRAVCPSQDLRPAAA